MATSSSTSYSSVSPSSRSGDSAELPTSWSVLIVDDDENVRKAFTRVLSSLDCEVVCSAHGHDAIVQLGRRDFDVIVCDIRMPDMTGIDLLREVREHDLELPVILVTGEPDFETAADAVEFGAFKYLTKPIQNKQLQEAVERAAKLRRLGRARQRAMQLAGTDATIALDRAGLEAQFNRALDKLWVAFQPIVCAERGQVVAYEALCRSDEPSLRSPAGLLDVAERLDEMLRFGRRVRERACVSCADLPDDFLLFINLHASELTDPQLIDEQSPLCQMAQRVVLEITERAPLDHVRDVPARISSLRSRGYRIAIDDLGAGYAGLSAFAALEPDFVKLDMSLVRGVDKSRTRQKVIKSITRLCRELQMKVVGEGVETALERDVLRKLGCDYLQGFLFAPPGPPFPSLQNNR